MPTYEYECTNLHRFEKWQSMKDDALTECLECGAPVRRIMHPAGIIFKGSGWYITDSRKGGSASDSDSAALPKGKTDAKSEGGDAKADAKSDSKSGGDTKSESKGGGDAPKSESKSDSSSSAKSGSESKKSGSSSE